MARRVAFGMALERFSHRVDLPEGEGRGRGRGKEEEGEGVKEKEEGWKEREERALTFNRNGSPYSKQCTV